MERVHPDDRTMVAETVRTSLESGGGLDYEFRDNTLETQTYEIHRDLSSWVASLGFVTRNNGTTTKTQNDYGFVLTFTLKDLPDLRLPVSFNPGGQGSSGTGKNR